MAATFNSKKTFSFFLGGIFSFYLSNLQASETDLSKVQTVTEYNDALIDFGVAWKAGGGVYFPSIYTGFAPREEIPERIHLQLGRGNQARLTVILDEQSVLTYLYSLKARALFIKQSIENKWITPVQQLQINAFTNLVLNSDQYRIQNTIADFENGKISKSQFYSQSLNILRALNPGRIFELNFNFVDIIQKWRQNDLTRILNKCGGNKKSIIDCLNKNSNEALLVANNMLFGRINAFNLNTNQIQQLANLIVNSKQTLNNDDLMTAKNLFQDLTGNKYQILSSQNDELKTAFHCEDLNNCTLSYAEFTAIYPVGSVKDYTTDRDGNTIPRIREVGGLHFIDRETHDVDHIRGESFYGWVPKMDYTQEGNAIHNPAVRTSLRRSQYTWLYDTLHIPKNYDTYWAVSRGGVSHGCTRMAAGHILEVRQIFPSDPTTMTRVLYYGNSASDYDLFDIDGSGTLQVMGVDYLIAYALASDSGDGYREAVGFIPQALKKDDFYQFLYGSKNQFYKDGNDFIFTNPYMTYFSGNPLNGRAKAYSVQLQGSFKLYEQSYEKDKMQFVNIKTGNASLSRNSNNKTNISAQLVRLFGRINACGPFVEDFKNTCNEEQFNTEATELSKLLN